MHDAIARLEPLAQKDEREFQALFAVSAIAALPNRFEHHPLDLERAFETFGSAPEDCARASTSAREIFLRAASRGADGEALARIMVEEGASATLASACASAWTAGMEDALKRIRATPFGAPKILTDVQWELRVPLTGSERGLLVGLDLELSEQTHCGKPTRETFNCEFDHAGLVEFFGNVEKIQSQLDALT